MRFHIIGTSLKKDAVKKILELGGEPVRKIDGSLAACISSQGEMLVLQGPFSTVKHQHSSSSIWSVMLSILFHRRNQGKKEQTET